MYKDTSCIKDVLHSMEDGVDYQRDWNFVDEIGCLPVCVQTSSLMIDIQVILRQYQFRTFQSLVVICRAIQVHKRRTICVNQHHRASTINVDL